MTFSAEVTLTFTTGENQLLVVSYRLLLGRGTGDYGTFGALPLSYAGQLPAAGFEPAPSSLSAKYPQSSPPTKDSFSFKFQLQLKLKR